MHPIQDLFLEGFSYVLQIDMHFICTPMWTKFYSCKKWVLQTARYDHINLFGKSKHVSTLVLPRISCIASGFEDEHMFKLGGCVGAHKTPISCANISSKCIK
jgi:hypothetical protein